MSHSIIIHTNNKKDLSILEEFAKKMGLSAQVLSNLEKEELGLAMAIKENDSAEPLELNDALEFYKTLNKAN